MSEQKQPHRHEFWEVVHAGFRFEKGLRVQVAHVSGHQICLEEKDGNLIIAATDKVIEQFAYLPDCDSFNWQPESVESPEDWVTQDRVPDRPGIDEWNRTWDGRPTVWEPSLKNEERYMHGHVCTATGSVFKVRCRRKDLPPLPQETPKRDYVRFLFRDCDGRFYLADSSKELIFHGYRELKHDGTGFYLEDSK